MTKFNPKDHMGQIQGKDYLQVNWRIVWFREVHPLGRIETQIETSDPLIMKAFIYDDEGKPLSTGHGSPKTKGVSSGRPYEGAETAAIGRALAHAGFGTQFTGEDEGEHLADAPVEKKAEHKTPEQENKELGFVDKKKKTPFNIMEFIVENTDIENTHHAAGWVTKMTNEGASVTKVNAVALRNKYNKEKE